MIYPIGSGLLTCWNNNCWFFAVKNNNLLNHVPCVIEPGMCGKTKTQNLNAKKKMLPLFKHKVTASSNLTPAQESAVESEIKEFIDQVINREIHPEFGNSNYPFQFEIMYGSGQVGLRNIASEVANEKFVEYLVNNLKDREEVKKIGIITPIRGRIANREDKFLKEMNFEKIREGEWVWKRRENTKATF